MSYIRGQTQSEHRSEAWIGHQQRQPAVKERRSPAKNLPQVHVRPAGFRVSSRQRHRSKAHPPIVATAINTHTTSSQNGDPRDLAMSAGVKKIPTPMTFPTIVQWPSLAPAGARVPGPFALSAMSSSVAMIPRDQRLTHDLPAMDQGPDSSNLETSSRSRRTSTCSSSAGLKPNGCALLESNPHCSINQVQPAGHSAVASTNRIANRVDEHRHPQFEPATAHLHTLTRSS